MLSRMLSRPVFGFVSSYLKASPSCLQQIRGNFTQRFSVDCLARSDFHLSVLEAVYISRQKPELCAQKDFVRSLFLF